MKNCCSKGVTAVDEKDGDVSDSLLVEKVAGTNGKEVDSDLCGREMGK